MRYLTASLALCLSVLSLPAQDTAAYKNDPKYVAAMSEGKKLSNQRQYTFAMDAYKKAGKLAGGKDSASLRELLDLEMMTGSYRDAIKTSTVLEELAATPKDKAESLVSRGNALYQQAGTKARPELLHEADDAYKAALAQNPKSVSALYMDGRRSPGWDSSTPRSRSLSSVRSACRPKTRATHGCGTLPRTRRSRPPRWPQPSSSPRSTARASTSMRWAAAWY